ncbi:MAG: hypothetical protein IKQ95_10455 [Synergistaceae bacterium]|nr:hypothetical protein [Synergistaceae bacterium]
MNIKQVSIFIEHVPGTLHKVVKTLAENDIHIRAFSAVEFGGIDILRLIVDNILWTASHLKTLGYPATFKEVIAVSIPNTAERLCKVLEIMRNAGINIEYSYSLVLKNYSAGFIFEVDDSARAAEALTEAGIKVITQEELQTL